MEQQKSCHYVMYKSFISTDEETILKIYAKRLSKPLSFTSLRSQSIEIIPCILNIIRITNWMFLI